MNSPTSLKRIMSRLKRESGLSTYAFAKKLKVSPNTLRGWLTGQVKSMNRATARRVQKALGLSRDQGADYFYHGELPPSPYEREERQEPAA